jgi:hypothetical protein
MSTGEKRGWDEQGGRDQAKLVRSTPGGGYAAPPLQMDFQRMSSTGAAGTTQHSPAVVSASPSGFGGRRRSLPSLTIPKNNLVEDNPDAHDWGDGAGKGNKEKGCRCGRTKCLKQYCQVDSQPSTLHPKPFTLNSSPSTLYPDPFTLNPSPRNLHPAPLTPNPHPSALNPKPETRNPKPDTRKQCF